MHKNRFQKLIAVVLFLAIIILPMFTWHTFSLYNKFDFDLGEKRYKATLSDTLCIENFPSEYEKYYNDRLPFRSIIITLKQNIDAAVEKPYKSFEKLFFNTFGVRSKDRVLVKEIDGVIRLYMDDAVDIFRNHKLKSSDIDPYVEDVDYPIKKLSSQVIIGQSDWLYLDIQNMPYYIGSNTPTLDDLERYKLLYTAMQNLCKLHDKQIVFLICPEKEEIYHEYMPTMEIVNEKERPIYIRDYLATASDIIYLYPKEEIYKQKSNYRIYKKYDSHWNDVGAYLTSNALKVALGIETTPLRDLKVERIPETNKDLLYLAGISITAYNDSFEYFINYKPTMEVRKLYSDSIIEGHILDVESDALDKRHLLIMGDSYRIKMVDFLSKDFRRVTSVTFNHMDDTRIVDNAIKDADIIVLQAVNRNEADTIPLMCKKIVDVLNE